jgi:2-polyprenyl-3-methyl-5-hydroxy-6-metoxy-1,4-benzoquinol methylase
MSLRDTDRDWEKFAQEDPYWAVLTHDQFKKEALTPEAIAEFFESGERRIAHVWKQIESHFTGEPFKPRRAMDFGCGVGRLLFPIARRSVAAVGVDISPSMLNLAGEKARENGLSNVEFVQSDDTLSRAKPPFDLIHSHLVLQHIPVPRGMAIIERMVELLGDGGVGAIQITYQNLGTRHSPLKQARSRTVRRVRKLVGKPVMQMNEYPLADLFSLLRANGVSECHLEVDVHATIASMMLYFQKKAQ